MESESVNVSSFTRGEVEEAIKQLGIQIDSYSLISGDGQCNEKDKELWDTKNDEMKEALRKCGKDCWGKAACTSECMMKKEPFSANCADCFGKFSSCGASNCWWKCMFNSQSAGCIRCAKENCEKPFIQCSGLSSPF